MAQCKVTLGGTNRLYARQKRALSDAGFILDSGMGSGKGHWSNRWHVVEHPTMTEAEILAFVRSIKGRAR